MATRPSGALRRAPTLVQLRAPSRPRRPSQRGVLVGLACVLAAALAYAAARETSLFAATEIVVSGGSPSAQREVRTHVAALDGSSLVALDPDGLASALERLPTVRTADVDRAFPHTLSIAIEEERPLAVLADEGRAMLVSVRGRAIREVSPGALPRVPRVAVDRVQGLDPGEAVTQAHVAEALRALAHVPRRFPLRVVSASVSEEGVTLALDGEIELRLGDATALRAKIAAAGAVLRSLPPEERRALAYVDATLPNRVVVSTNPQVEG